MHMGGQGHEQGGGPALERRIEELESHQAGLELLARVAQMIDLADPEGWLDCYTADGIFRFQAVPGGPDVFAIEGVGALRDWFADHRTLLPAGRQTHLLVNPRLTREGDRIKGTSTYFTLLDSDGVVLVASSGLWLDELVRSEDGQWRIRERCVVRLMPGPAS
jgi:3-phenylpropionate/cinnamic acid dioxygenase small subunit